MDSDIAWEECVGDLPLDPRVLPPLHALPSSSSSNLPDLDLLDLITFDHPTDTPSSPLPHKPLPDSSTGALSPVTTASPVISPPSSCTPSNTSSQASASRGASPPPPPVTTATTVETPTPTPTPTTESSTPAPPLTDQSQLVLELSTRLASAGAEATALRKRVASLASENRSLRAALDHANARLVAVAQAASVPPAHHQPAHAGAAAAGVPPATGAAPVGAAAPAPPSLMFGLAHVPADVAGRLANVLTLSDASNGGGVAGDMGEATTGMGVGVSEDPPRKKRKRVGGAAATTMACVMFMWGALVGSPAWISGTTGTARSQANLPAVWKGEGPGALAVRAGGRPASRRAAWRQPNCMRKIGQLPDGKSESALDAPNNSDSVRGGVHGARAVKPEPMMLDDGSSGGSANGLDSGGRDGETDVASVDDAVSMFVDMEDREAATAVSKADSQDPRHPRYSYVLCRDAQAALSNVKACARRMRQGESCGEPHTLSLILPAEAAGMMDDDGNETTGGLAGRGPALAEVQCSITAVARIPVEASTGESPYGRIIATVPDTATVIQG